MAVLVKRAGQDNMDHWQERADLAAAFRWVARLDMHEGVANHFSLRVEGARTPFLLNPNQRHFARIRASDLLLLHADDDACLNGPDAPDPTAWGLHGAIHRRCPQARCVMHVHSMFATVLACLEDPIIPPIDQNTAMFYNRTVVDADYAGLAFTAEGERCAALFNDAAKGAAKKVMIMGNHGVLVIGDSVADTFNRLYYFERAAQTYIRALQTGKPLKVLEDAVAEKTARQIDNYPSQATQHFAELKAILDTEGANYAS